MIALLGAGLYSIVMIPKESAPSVEIPVGIVSTTLPGASAEDIESLVTDKIEKQLNNNLANLDTLTSSSREGVSVITAQFNANANIDTAITELKDEVDKAAPDLPSDANTPVVSQVDFVDQPILTVAVGGDLSDSELNVLADELQDELEDVAGVSRIEQAGVRDREVSVVVRESALQQYDLTLGEVISGISSANTTFPVGAITTDGVDYNIALEGDIQTVDEIASIPLTSYGGQPVYVRDVATVKDGFKEAKTITRLSVDGAPAISSISLNVYKADGANITTVARAVNDKVTTLQAEDGLLSGLTTEIILDSGKEIEKDLWQLTSSGLETIVLVVILLVVAIGWREGLLAGMAIPLSFTIGFVGLYLSDNTINFVSLFALILAVGILVDSAIVVVEGINRRMKDDPNIDKRDAALKTVREFAVPLMSGTLTTVAMFSGLFLISGVSGQFIASIPFTINFVHFASLLVALGFLPLLASLFLRRRNLNALEIKQQEYSRKLESWYATRLDTILQNRRYKIYFLSAIVLGFIIAVSLPIIGVVKVIFFDQEDIDWIYAEIELPEATELSVTDLTARRAEEILYENDSIDSFVTTVGASSAFASNSGGSQNSRYASYFITLRSDRDKTSTEVVNDLRNSLSVIKDANVSVGQPNNGPPTGSPLSIKFIGDDLTELRAAAERAALYLKRIDGTTNVETSANNNANQFIITIDRDQAAVYGLDPRIISQTLRTAIFGADATTIKTTNDDIDVVVKLAVNREFTTGSDTNTTSIENVRNLSIRTPQGNTVPLANVASISLGEASSVITHEDTKRVVTLTSDLAEGANLREVTNTFLANVESEANIPRSVTIEVGGENQESSQAFREMFLSLIVGVLLMLGILVLQFNSFRHTFYVLSILPFSLIGIMVGLALTGKALSFPSLMGFVALSGIVVNNSILLIDQMNHNRRVHKDRPLRENVVEAATSRLRPILLTTLTTVIGIFPLTFASDLWSPLAYAIMFGLSFSVVITLVLVPIIYLRKPGTLD